MRCFLCFPVSLSASPGVHHAVKTWQCSPSYTSYADLVPPCKRDTFEVLEEICRLRWRDGVDTDANLFILYLAIFTSFTIVESDWAWETFLAVSRPRMNSRAAAKSFIKLLIGIPVSLPSLCAVPGRGREAQSRNSSSSLDGRILANMWSFSARVLSWRPRASNESGLRTHWLSFSLLMRKEQAINNGALVLIPPPPPSLLNSSVFPPPYVIKQGLDLVPPFCLKFIG